MDTEDSRKIVPTQEIGSATNAEYSYTAASLDEAIVDFQDACARLLDVNNWHEYAGKGTSIFQVTDENGKDTDGAIRQGYYFKIDIPGPGTVTGEGFDWVKVEAIDSSSNPEEDWESIAVRVRPASNPNNQKPDVAHFFSEEASSNFVLRRNGTTITAGVYGRNEIPNTSAESILDKTRNAAVGLTAASGLSLVQWNSLVKGIIAK